MSPGTSQVYYGDESVRSLVIEGTEGDATLRSFMNWEELENNSETKTVLAHWQKLGQFRAKHPAVGAGVHQIVTEEPYVFYRSLTKGDYKDFVVIGLDLNNGEKVLDLSKVLKDGEVLHDACSGQDITVVDGKITVNSEFDTVLLSKKPVKKSNL